MREVVWSPAAGQANDILIRYLREQADDATARRVHQRILDAAENLGLISTGRPGRLDGTLEKSVAGTSHIILYALRSRRGQEFVLILDVVHAARDWRKAGGRPLPKSR